MNNDNNYWLKEAIKAMGPLGEMGKNFKISQEEVNNQKILMEFKSIIGVDVGTFLRLYLAGVLEIPSCKQIIDFIPILGVENIITFWQAFQRGETLEDLKKLRGD